MSKKYKKNAIFNTEVSRHIELPLNVSDLEKLEAELIAVEGEPEFDNLSESYTGPDTGLEYDDEKHKLSIVHGWHADENGNIVRDIANT